MNPQPSTSPLTLKPILDRIIVRPLPPEERTAGGIILPENAEHEKKKGEVLAVGPGAVATETGERIPPEVQPGDIILYDEVSADPYTIGGEECEILLHNAIIGIILNPQPQP